DQTVAPGTDVNFSIISAGTAQMQYQWRKNGVGITGATNSNYVLVNVQTNAAGVYTVVLSNTVGSVTSSNAVLSVVVPPPVLSGVGQGTNIVLRWTTNATGFTLQWTTNLGLRN